MGSIYGKNLKISVFGESHGEKIGVVIDGLLPGYAIDMNEVLAQMARRAPGKQGVWSTKRSETDYPHIVSGMKDGKTTGAPLCAFIENNAQRSSDYDSLYNTPRPGHAEFTANIRYRGASDMRGGGHFSGRLTAPIMFAGAICMQILSKLYGCRICSHISSISDVQDKTFDDVARESGWYESVIATSKRVSMIPEQLAFSDFPVIDAEASKSMIALIEAAASDSDSVGGTIETMIIGYPAGIGDPIFEGIESRIASILFSIPAVKGVDFGAGFNQTMRRGSLNNDEPHVIANEDNAATSLLKVENGSIINFSGNSSGGILGGITNGMPIIVRTAIKPTASIGKQQKSVDISTGNNVPIEIKGRHDPCIVPRAVPVTEAACAIALLDCCLGIIPL